MKQIRYNQSCFNRNNIPTTNHDSAVLSKLGRDIFDSFDNAIILATARMLSTLALAEYFCWTEACNHHSSESSHLDSLLNHGFAQT